jgi:hypothetical protein
MDYRVAESLRHTGDVTRDASMDDFIKSVLEIRGYETWKIQNHLADIPNLSSLYCDATDHEIENI